MLQKELTIDTTSFLFTFNERNEEWSLHDADYLDGYDTNLYFNNETFPDGNVDWEQVKEFILFLRRDFNRVMENISGAGFALQALFRTYYSRVGDLDVIENTGFDFKGILFRGASTYYRDDFVYDYLMIPYYKKDSLRDMGTALWKASFIRYDIYGVSREV